MGNKIMEMATSGLPPKLEKLGPWALVTGASDGIGAATARQLADIGFNVVLVARRETILGKLAREIATKSNVGTRVIAADLSKPEGVTGVFAALESQGIGLTDIGVAVLAAGFGTTGALSEADLKAEREMLRVNCEAVLHMSHVLSRAMAHRGAGHLALFGSIVGFQGNAMTANYAATKSYVQSLAEGLAVEMKSKGVTVQAVAPGPIASGFAARAGMTMAQAGTSEEVAHAIVNGIGRSGTIRPGLLSKILGYNMAITPRPLRVRIMSKIMTGMVKGKMSPEIARQEA